MRESEGVFETVAVSLSVGWIESDLVSEWVKTDFVGRRDSVLVSEATWLWVGVDSLVRDWESEVV